MEKSRGKEKEYRDKIAKMEREKEAKEREARRREKYEKEKAEREEKRANEREKREKERKERAEKMEKERKEKERLEKQKTEQEKDKIPTPDTAGGEDTSRPASVPEPREKTEEEKKVRMYFSLAFEASNPIGAGGEEMEGEESEEQETREEQILPDVCKTPLPLIYAPLPHPHTRQQPFYTFPIARARASSMSLCSYAP